MTKLSPGQYIQSVSSTELTEQSFNDTEGGDMPYMVIAGILFSNQFSKRVFLSVSILTWKRWGAD